MPRRKKNDEEQEEQELQSYLYEGAVAVQIIKKGAVGMKPIESVLPIEIEILADEEPTEEEVAFEAFSQAGEQADEQLDKMFPDRLSEDIEEDGE